MEKIRLGGQAVIEGVMMRGKNSYSVVVRKPNGELAIHKEKISNLADRYSFLNLPILRGCIALGETLSLGIKALSFSANEAAEEEMKGEDNKALSQGETFFTIFVSLGLGFLLFFVLPLILTNFIKSYFLFNNGMYYNFIDGLIRLTIFLVYIVSISQLKEIQRVFQYHGAEHKAVFNFESGDELSPLNAKKYSPLHPRCGTSFMLLVMIISMVIFGFIPRDASIFQKALWRLILIPLITGISYELIKLSGNKSLPDFIGKSLHILTQPGIWLQKLTTREPTDDQLFVAIVAIKEVLSLENAEVK